MTIWGKIIGGAAGFALGGPLGALLGTAAGHAVDHYRNNVDPGLARETAFAVAVIALSAKMAKADGRVSEAEIHAFRQVLLVPPEEERNVAWLFDIAQRDSRGFEPYARQVARMFRDRPEVLERLLDALFHIAKADRIVHRAEIDFLAEVARIFGFDAAAFERIRAANLGDVAGGAYAVLGLTPAAGDEEVREAWRRLVRQHHPDRLIGDGVPADFVRVANDKLAAINAAYAEIRELRGLARRRDGADAR